MRPAAGHPLLLTETTDLSRGCQVGQYIAPMPSQAKRTIRIAATGQEGSRPGRSSRGRVRIGSVLKGGQGFELRWLTAVY